MGSQTDLVFQLPKLALYQTELRPDMENIIQDITQNCNQKFLPFSYKKSIGRNSVHFHDLVGTYKLNLDYNIPL